MEISKLKLGYKIILGFIIYQIIILVINGFSPRYQDLLFFGTYLSFPNALLIVSIGMIILAVFKIIAIVKVPKWSLNYLFVIYSLEIVNALFNFVRWLWDPEVIIQNRLDLIPANMIAETFISYMVISGIIIFLIRVIINAAILIYIYKNKKHFKK